MLDSVFYIFQGRSITLLNVDHDVEGTYICTATNGLGHPSSTDMTIEIQYPPDVTTEEVKLMSC